MENDQCIITKSYKHRLNQLFNRKNADKIEEAIRYVHSIMCNATLLIKYRLVKDIYNSTNFNETQVWNAIRAVQHIPFESSGDEHTTKHSGEKRKMDKQNGNDPKKNKCCGERMLTRSKKIKKYASSSSSSGNLQPLNDRENILRSWIEDYKEMTSGCLDRVPLPYRGNDLSVSHILGCAAKQYTASLISNIRYHFRQYVCSALGIVLRSKVCSIEGLNRFEDFPRGLKKAWKREFGKAYDDILYHRHGESMVSSPLLHSVLNRHRGHLVPSLPPNKRSIDSDLDSSTRPFVYLQYMIRLSEFIEKTGGIQDGKRRRLLSPIPLKTSFIPSHYTIDTTGLVHLLLDNVKAFKKYFEQDLKSSGGFPLPHLKGKVNICGSLSSLAGREVTPKEEELFKDALWTFLGDFKNRRTKRLNPLKFQTTTEEGLMRFGHSISTDGYSVSILTTNKSVRGRRQDWKSGASKRKKKGSGNTSTNQVVPVAFKSEFPLLTVETVPDIVRYLRDIGCEEYDKFVGGDPGKGVLLALVDEFRRKLGYSSRQRRYEMDGGKYMETKKRSSTNANMKGEGNGSGKEKARKKRKKKKEKARKKNEKDKAEGRRQFKTSRRLINNATKKRLPGPISVPLKNQGSAPGAMSTTINHTTTSNLLKDMRKRKLSPKTTNLEKYREYITYREACRESFETTYLRNLFRAIRFNAWIKRNRSVEIFAEKILEKYGSSTINKQVVILYGDWGRRPNLKHQAPTPGIGLRRKLHGYIGKCGKRICTITVRETFTSSFDPDTLAPVSEARGIHALLREDPIPGTTRGIYWSRDILGALNILRKGSHLLCNQAAHPVFQG